MSAPLSSFVPAFKCSDFSIGKVSLLLMPIPSFPFSQNFHFPNILVLGGFCSFPASHSPSPRLVGGPLFVRDCLGQSVTGLAGAQLERQTGLQLLGQWIKGSFSAPSLSPPRRISDHRSFFLWFCLSPTRHSSRSPALLSAFQMEHRKLRGHVTGPWKLSTQNIYFK